MSRFVAGAAATDAFVKETEFEPVFRRDLQRFQTARAFRQTVDQGDHARLMFRFAFRHVDIDDGFRVFIVDGGLFR